MSGVQKVLAALAGLASLLTLVFALAGGGAQLLLVAFGVAGVLTFARIWLRMSLWIDGALCIAGTWALLASLPEGAPQPAAFWFGIAAAWLFAWLFVERLSEAIRHGRVEAKWAGALIPVMFGLALLAVWELITRGAGVPQVLLPAPSQIGQRIAVSQPLLWADFIQTFKAVLAGYAIGCGAGFVVAILVDRSPFLKRGLLPIGNFVSALPVIGIAPIMVMWFGFDWPSKAAVVVAMTFFPMLVNTVAGLNAASSIERDLMRTYAAGYWGTLAKLRLPAAAPFIFNALKINSTLALIGAIVAEFFGTPIVGMGFRISTEVGKLNIDLVWAEIAVAAVAGSAFYGIIALIERAVTFWHPSVRGGRA